MDEVCRIVGTKLIKEWVSYGKRIGKVESDGVNDLYKWVQLLEEDFDEFFDLKKDIDNIDVIRKGKNDNKRLEYELKIKFNLIDEDFVFDDEVINGKKYKDDYKIYISNIKDMEVW